MREQSKTAAEKRDWPGVFEANDRLFRFARTLQRQLVWEFKDLILDILRRTADGFIRRSEGRVQIWASSLDWFRQEWGRDTFVSLPGLLLATKRF